MPIGISNCRRKCRSDLLLLIRLPVRMLIGMPTWTSHKDAYKDFVRQQRVPSKNFIQEGCMEMPRWVPSVRDERLLETPMASEDAYTTPI